MKRLILASLFCLLTFISVFSQQAEKIDEFEDYQCEDLMARLDRFATKFQENPLLKGVIIAYEGKYAKYVYDRKGNSEIKYILPTFGESAYRLRVIKAYLFSHKGFSKNQLSFIDGGYREKHKVELWLVPKGSAFPKSSPELDKIKYRKGKPINMACRIG